MPDPFDAEGAAAESAALAGTKNLFYSENLLTWATTQPDIFHQNGTTMPCPSRTDHPSSCYIDCKRSDRCNIDEVCCVIGCSMICEKAVIPMHFKSTGLAFAIMLVAPHAIAQPATSGQKSG